jgi:hypothetical protein
VIAWVRQRSPAGRPGPPSSGYVPQTGKVVLADTAENLLKNPQMRAAYLGEP